MKTQTVSALLFTLVLVCGLLSNTQAVVPPPDGGYPNFTTAEGTNALRNLTTGAGNTGVGWYSLFSDATASFNTAVGVGTLLFNTADQNTALGAAALLFDTTGGANTATGASALLNNTTGGANTATGASALASNITGFDNTATGYFALSSNITGSFNTALGINAGFSVTTASNVICIGADGENASDSCYIGNIFGATSVGGAAVFVNSSNKLGTATSSKRFKDDIKPVGEASEALFALKPVSFCYKKEIDPAGTSQFGLVAEDVEKVNPDLVVRDKEGKPYSVRYDQVNAMLLNEFLKQHATMQELKKEIATLKAGFQKLNAQVELTQAEPRTAANN